jgi:membrane fusion protein (multidrug efflux system)
VTPAPPAPPTQAVAPVTPGHPAPAKPARRRRSFLRIGLLVLGPLVVLVAVAWFYITGARWVSTDNAYVKAAMSEISTEVDGRVQEVDVKENQKVAKGDVLFRLDPEPYRIALQKADAQLGMVKSDILALEVGYKAKQEQVAQAETDMSFAQRELDRQQELAKSKVSSVSKLDDAQHAFDTAQHNVAELKQDLAQLAAQLDGDPEIAPEKHSRYLQALAARDAAALDLRRTTVDAPAPGIVRGADQLRPGDYLDAGKVALTLVGSQRVWIEANFKETDLTYVQLGQPVEIAIDTYPNHSWRGTVDSISPATGAEFSLLPAQNSTGNWVKVVQRIPVRIAVDAHDGGGPDLRAGMSAEVDIDTGHEAELPGIVKSALAFVRNDHQP